LNRLPSAERWYREAVSESPQQYANLVSVLAAQGKMDEAISLCEAAAKTDDSAQPALALAVALVESSGSNADFQRADKLLQNAVKRFGTHQNLLYTVALVDILRNANQEAVALLRQVVALNGRHVPALNNLALLLADAREHREEAVRLIDEAIRIAGPAAGLLDTKGSILVYCGRSAEAIESLQAATRNPKADPRHHFHLAIAYCDTGRIADAKRHLRIALDRQLQSQVLTSTDRELLMKLLASLNMEKPVSTTAVVR
jgi:tetratricopeptide (TPR) repeat protein